MASGKFTTFVNEMMDQQVVTESRYMGERVIPEALVSGVKLDNLFKHICATQEVSSENCDKIRLIINY